MAESETEDAKGGAVSSLLSPLVVNFFIMMIVLVVFAQVIKRYAWCYQPRLARPNAKERRKKPPAIQVSVMSPFSWIWTVRF